MDGLVNVDAYLIKETLGQDHSVKEVDPAV